jgi:Fe-Mn family superoxide dismutase
MAPNAGGAPLTHGSVIKGVLDLMKTSLPPPLKGEARKQFCFLWVFVDKRRLKVTSSQNQDNPLMKNARFQERLYWLDLWEHAYYLGYQYRRRNYIDSFFNVINWKKGENYEAALRKNISSFNKKKC